MFFDDVKSILFLIMLYSTVCLDQIFIMLNVNVTDSNALRLDQIDYL